MKRMFIAAMAIAALVSCSKDNEDAILLSKEKSVTVTIQNSVIAGSRATVDGSTLNPTAEGGEATAVTPQVGADETLVADLSKLYILFANSKGVIVKKAQLTAAATPNIHANEGINEGEYVPGGIVDGAYTFHRVPETVKTVAVYRDTKGLATISEGTTTLTQVKAYAEVESSNLNVGVQDIFLYAEGDLGKSNECYEAEVDGVKTTYYYYTTTLNIKPQFARFELVKVSCDDLGKYNSDQDDTTYGLDELVINKFTLPLNGKTYTKTWSADNHLYGSYCATASKNAETALTAITPGNVTVGEGSVAGAWSWNIAPGTAALGTLPITLDLTASAHDYTVNNPAKVVRVVELNKTAAFEFEKGKVYRLELDFSEDNIDQTDDQLCVKATVVIDEWEVVLVEPTFGTEPAEAPAE